MTVFIPGDVVCYTGGLPRIIGYAARHKVDLSRLKVTDVGQSSVRCEGLPYFLASQHCERSDAHEPLPYIPAPVGGVPCPQWGPQQPAQGIPVAPPANPKQLYGDKKPPLQLIHDIAALHESTALHAGARKYGKNNYLSSKVEIMTYVGAILRHVQQYASGERRDAKEHVHHLAAIKACCTILLTCEATGMLIDDRPTTAGLPPAQPAPVSYDAAHRATFAEVEGIIEHLNKLYPAKL